CDGAVIFSRALRSLRALRRTSGATLARRTSVDVCHAALRRLWPARGPALSLVLPPYCDPARTRWQLWHRGPRYTNCAARAPISRACCGRMLRTVRSRVCRVRRAIRMAADGVPDPFELGDFVRVRGGRSVAEPGDPGRRYDLAVWRNRDAGILLKSRAD